MIYDTVTAALESFARRELDRVIEQCRSVKGAEVISRDPPAKPADGGQDAIREQLGHLKEEVAAICSKYPVFRLLILARKFRLSAISDVLRRELATDGQEARLVFMQASLFATNFILRHSSNPMNVEHIEDRNFLNPSESEIRDAFRVMILSAIFTWKTFFLNTLARHPLASDAQFDQLIELYNRRASRDRKASLTLANEPKLMVLTSTQSLPIKPLLSVTGMSPRPLQLLLINYVPVPIDAGPWRRAYSYVDGKDFKAVMGSSYADAWKCWVGLNMLALNALPNWTPGKDFDASHPTDCKRVERFFDVCETGLGGGSLHDLSETCHEILAARLPDYPTPKVHREWINKLTIDRLNEDPEFVEIPYLFYRVGLDVVLWDHARHGGLWKAIARNLLVRSGAAGKRKGELFEEALVSALQGSGAAGLCSQVKLKRNGARALEVDVAFTLGAALILVEAKSRLKPVAYYSGSGVHVSAHVQKLEGELAERDKQLRANIDLVRKRWPSPELRGAIYVLCTDEAEFIPSLDASFWIEPLTLPRLCVPEELVALASRADSSRLEQHPCFVRFA